MPARGQPAYTFHKPTGQARVRIDGKDHYLGLHGSPESRDRYDELIRNWQLRQSVDVCTITLGELSLRFDEWARRYYRHPDGTPTGTDRNVRDAMKYVNQLYANVRVRDFGPQKLKRVRESTIEAGRCRTQINRMMWLIRRVIRWGVTEELVPERIYNELQLVEPLIEGRTAAIESAPVEAVFLTDVEAALPHMPIPVAAMVRLQLLTGARPGEIRILRPCDGTFGTDDVWTYRPERHKTRHKGKDRLIFFGPVAQDVLRLFLECDPQEFCFSPARAEAERNAERRRSRQTPMTPSQAARRPQGRKLSKQYRKDAYNRAILRACEKADVEPWSPNQLRHARATQLAAEFGQDAARVVLGHSDVRTTQIYAERDFTTAREIAKQVG